MKIRLGAAPLDRRRTRLIYDDKHIFINGESYLASGRDAQLIRLLSDKLILTGKDVKRLSEGARIAAGLARCRVVAC